MFKLTSHSVTSSVTRGLVVLDRYILHETRFFAPLRMAVLKQLSVTGSPPRWVLQNLDRVGHYFVADQAPPKAVSLDTY